VQQLLQGCGVVGEVGFEGLFGGGDSCQWGWGAASRSVCWLMCLQGECLESSTRGDVKGTECC
jgi:hypothetical protein